MIIPTEMANVRLDQVEKTYGKSHGILRDFDLTVQDGELLVLVGPSGCGKSTILRIIAGLEEVTSGRIWIGDRDVTDEAPKDRDIAMVFQSYALYPHKTVRGNLGFALQNQKRSKAEIAERTAWAADILGIEPLLDKLPRALSGGERQRVALGRAIVRQPKVFLFDEPLSNLDAKLRSEMRAEIGAIHQRLGTTMVYVTHDQVEAMTLGQRIAVLNRGVIQQIGTPMEIYDRPANRFVATFVGTPSMNFLPSSAFPQSSRLFGTGTSSDTSIGTATGASTDTSTGTGTGTGTGTSTSTGMGTGTGTGISASSGTSASSTSTVVGIRPEDLVLDAAGPVRMRITLVEPTGGESFVHGETDHGKVVARTGGYADLRAGEEVRYSFDPRKAHLFDQETGSRVDR